MPNAIKRNVILLAAPLSGARPLARALVDSGWNTGGLAKPDLRDPSLSSFENEMLVSANQIVLNGTKIPNLVELSPEFNWFSRFRMDGVSDVPHEWVDSIFVNFSRSPCLLKDSQLLWTFHKWWPIWQPQQTLPTASTNIGTR